MSAEGTARCCERCGGSMEGKRPNARYCSIKCKDVAHWADLKARPSVLTQADAKRFWETAHITRRDECWEWQGARMGVGYGRFYADNGRPHVAHRVAYQFAYRPVPDGLVVDHLCRNVRCVNPWHLEAVTHGENTRRGTSQSALNAKKTHCKHGHEFTPENTHVDTLGRRVCRTCANANRRRRYAAAVRSGRAGA